VTRAGAARARKRASTQHNGDGSADAGIGGTPRLGKGAAVAEVRAEMVANVWKVVVTEGDQVAEGDTIVILESMKMEIPIVAEDAGALVKLHVAEGDVIQEGDLIAIIE
jgi:acetyl-CoA carboxylase biotin carboxyl carrier protein